MVVSSDPTTSPQRVLTIVESDSDSVQNESDLQIPDYLQNTYWWAYLHPNAVRFFERQWLVNLILWGNFARLRDHALAEIGDRLEGRNLQVACVYGDFTPKVAQRLAPDARLDVVDIAPVQLENLKKKIDGVANVHLQRQDSTRLRIADGHYDNTIVFFLLHEQPLEARVETIREAVRVTRPGGKVIFVDYHRPSLINPFRYVMIPILRLLEPFAMDMWRKEIIDWLPESMRPAQVEKETYFGGLYQKVVFTR
ncbi:MAG: class I SAM-dependent methyltransferase [Magnetococcales bacterium]|nr:class I SAM-dependent methyltransferase [Magnetococcales bacterium]